MTPLRKSDELLAWSEHLRQELDEHVDALMEVVSELREVAHLPTPDPEDPR